MQNHENGLQLGDGCPRAQVRTRGPLKCASLCEWEVHPQTRNIAACATLSEAILCAGAHAFMMGVALASSPCLLHQYRPKYHKRPRA